MAPATKANYKSFEAQARLIRAIVAAHPETKWNYKEIAACYGSDMTADALKHRFRRFRAEAIIITEARKQNLDMKELKTGNELPATQGAVDTKNISKYFGQSTADGIQFQFRSIKTDAKRLKDAANNGEDVANTSLPGINGGGSAASTPSRATPSKPKGTKRKQPGIIKTEIASDFDCDFDDDDSSPQDWSEKDIETPTKKRSKLAAAGKGATPGQKNGTPSRRSATMAAGTITASDVTANLSESYSEPEPPTANPASIFGNPNPSTVGNAAFNRGAMDSLIGGDDDFIAQGGIIDYYPLDINGDGEI